MTFVKVPLCSLHRKTERGGEHVMDRGEGGREGMEREKGGRDEVCVGEQRRERDFY